MDFAHPIEAVIPGAAGRLLAALARVDAELPVSRLAAIWHVRHFADPDGTRRVPA